MKKLISSLIFAALLLGNSTSYAQSYLMHTVQTGDTYASIAKEHNTSVDTIRSLNTPSEYDLYSGSLIKIKPVKDQKAISIKVDSKVVSTDQYPYIENSRTFVPIRFIAESLGANVSWDQSSQEAILEYEDKIIRLPIYSSTATINGSSVALDAPVNIYNARTFVPVRFIAETFDCSVDWNGYDYVVDIQTENYSNKNIVDDNVPSYSSEDLYWLSRLVHAESQGESYEGKLAVANVIVNRKNSDLFPASIKGVIFDNNYGIQYTPVANGRIYNTPSNDSIQAAKQALEGHNNISTCLYFLNPRKSTNNWIVWNRFYFKTIQNHDFYL
ncbi:stalk domain-containing protein [Tepidibacter hydrothermalis]|uniref:Stalk domain-containing protein n=1 Tax=Tepidibacter hydrothermalis TaxID=3036126 RepID=A0ABY8EDH1_9FIRM|nr:stalk domain-containing protein [Tepidibacter hydrothermalis]WFD10988.1 stalk domain-containing protein [Tepidibacter hydrothermalis]